MHEHLEKAKLGVRTAGLEREQSLESECLISVFDQRGLEDTVRTVRITERREEGRRYLLF